MKLTVHHRLIALRYGMDNQIDGYKDQIGDTTGEAFGIECQTLAPAGTGMSRPTCHRETGCR